MEQIKSSFIKFFLAVDDTTAASSSAAPEDSPNLFMTLQVAFAGPISEWVSNRSTAA